MATLSIKAELCNLWGNPEIIGYLDKNIFIEASGIEVSDNFKNRLYHINDSGKELNFYITDMKGNNVKTVGIKGFNHTQSDFEDLSIGPCFSNTCLFIGDIGDNLKKRTEINIIVINERKTYPETITPLKILRLRYPDKPHDAESLAVHPNGDIYIITKESDFKQMKYYPAKIYVLQRKVWEKNTGQPITLDLVGEIDTGSLIGGNSFFLNNIITSIDISKDGKKFIILTYQNAFEFYVDLSKIENNSFSNTKNNLIYKFIDLIKLPQQEAISYANSGRSFIYNSEYIKNHNVEIYRVDCKDNFP